jgi:hypothetical protein
MVLVWKEARLGSSSSLLNINNNKGDNECSNNDMTDLKYDCQNELLEQGEQPLAPRYKAS